MATPYFMNKPLKMYICVKKSIPSHKVLAIAHGVLMAHLKFARLVIYQDWINNSFRKVVVEVTDEEFEDLKKYDNFVTINECGLNNMETVISRYLVNNPFRKSKALVN